MLVGIKPTVGLISRYGIAPITADQDTAGPMARTVADAAILLGAMVGVDPNDPATNACMPPPGRDYTRFLRLAGLRGRAHRHSARGLLPPGDATRHRRRWWAASRRSSSR